MLVAVGETVHVVPFGFGEASRLAVTVVDVAERQASLILEASGGGHLQRSMHRSEPVAVGVAGHVAQRVKGVDERLGHTQRFADRLCPPRRFDCLVVGALEHPFERHRPVGPCQLAARAEWLEGRHGGFDRRGHRGAAALHPHRAREPA